MKDSGSRYILSLLSLLGSLSDNETVTMEGYPARVDPGEHREGRGVDPDMDEVWKWIYTLSTLLTWIPIR